MQTQVDKLRRQLMKLPTPAGGLALGIGSLGLILEEQLGTGGIVQITSAVLAACLLGVLVTRFTLAPSSLHKDLRHPVVGLVAPTVAMALMIVSKTVVTYGSAQIGFAIWGAAVALHLGFSASFIWHRLKDPALHHMVPSWFIPPVGIAVAAVTFSGAPDGAMA